MATRGKAMREVLAYWGQERRTLRQGFAALGISTGVGMAAGVVLAHMESLLSELPGLLLLVPAAIGMRGAIFGALAARLGTGIMTGQFTPSWERRSFAVQNVEASALLTLFSSALAAVAARVVAGAFGLPTMSLWELVTISMVGGVLSSVVILFLVLILASTAQRREWDMDAIGAPLVTTIGDIVTLPALVVGTLVIADERIGTVAGIALLVLGAYGVWQGTRSQAPITRRIVQESLVVLVYAAALDVLAGGVLETRVHSFVANPALLILVPPFIANCGSLGGILAARLGSDLHLGLVEPRPRPQKQALLQGSLTVLFSLAAFSGVGLIAHVASAAFGFGSPGLARMVGVALAGGAFAFILLFLVAYYAATATYRFGLDPDNHGIPIVTATMDFFGVGCLVAAIVLFGVT